MNEKLYGIKCTHTHTRIFHCVCVCVWMRVVCLSLSRGFGVRGYRVATVDRSFGNRANCW